MTKIIKNLIFLILFLIISCQNAFCYTLTPNELNQVITDRLKNEVIRKLNLKQSEAEIKIKVSNIPNAPVVTKTSAPKIEISAVNIIQPDSLRRVTIKNSDNTIANTFNVNVHTSVFKEVLVASENIPFNKEITNRNTKLEKTDILKYYNRVLNRYENDLIAKRNYQKGSLILADYTKQKAQVCKNSMVDIVFLSKGIKIKLQGMALKDGNIGDTILVRSDKYNKIYNAKVSSSNEVVVKI